MIKQIVVGTDGSATAASAVLQARELAKQVGARVHVVSAYEPLRSADRTGLEGSVTPDSGAQAVLADAAGVVRGAGVECETYARRQDPAEALLDVAEEQNADVIIVGNKGMSGAKRYLLGSVPNKVSHHAGCSVFIVRTTE